MRAPRTTIGCTAVAALFGAALACAQTLPSAAAILDQAKAQAASGERRIFANFHASW